MARCKRHDRLDCPATGCKTPPRGSSYHASASSHHDLVNDYQSSSYTQDSGSSSGSSDSSSDSSSSSSCSSE